MTAASESTKQRWHVETQEVSDGGRIPLTHIGVFVRNELGENIAKTIAEQANLIAAAPLLLEAAEAVLAYFGVPDFLDPPALHGLQDAVMAARGEGSAQ